MMRFREFLTESVRQGLPHITTMDHRQFGDLIKDKKVHVGSKTEKTDGMTHVMGHDEHGFYTQSSGSGAEKMRKPEDFHDRAKRRSVETGKPYQKEVPDAFAHIHKMLSSNKSLQDHLKTAHKKHGEVKIRGEAFYRPFGREGDHPHETKFVGTSYDTRKMGSHGSYILHSKLPENHHVDHETWHKHSTPDMKFDHDRMGSEEKDHVDVAHEHDQFHKLNHELLNARTVPSNKEQKLKEMDKVSKLRNSVSSKIDKHIKSKNHTPKWGSGSEGIVVHPTKHNPSAPRFKVTSDAFRSYKADPDSEAKFKSKFASKPLKEELLMEGGNIKVGEHHAVPIQIKEHNRKEVAGDIRHTLGAIHDSYHKETGHHMFGKDQHALNTGAAFSGSTRHLFNKHIDDKEFAKHKSSMGDVDSQVSEKHRRAIVDHLKTGKRFGAYSVVATKHAGQESHVLMKHHKSGHVHQFDFEGVNDYAHDEPTKHDQFAHNSDWTDTKAGIKGMHHKMLLNAVSKKYKRTNNGLMSRENEHEAPITDIRHMTKKLFGGSSDHEKLHSFHGITELIKKHIPAREHKDIVNKFETDTAKKPGSEAAVAHLKKHLTPQKHLNESVVRRSVAAQVTATHHASVIPLVGFSPISHMGHAHDLGNAMHKLPGKKHIGVSKKADVFSPQERSNILGRQWGSTSGIRHHAVTSGGETIAKAFHSLPKHGRKVLHLLVGHDRKEMAQGLKQAVMNGKIKELGAHKFDEVHIHHPEDARHSHGMSGTKMRESVAKGDKKTFARHMGPMFTPAEHTKAFNRIHHALATKVLKIKR